MTNQTATTAVAGSTTRRPFAGWRMLAIAALAVFATGPAQTYGVSPFVNPMTADLGISRSLFSTLYSIGTLVSAGVLIVAGRQLDRYGNRLVLAVAAVLFGAGLALMGVATGLLSLLLGFIILRSFGQGVVSLGARTLVPHWFHSRAGRAFSILGIGGMASQAVVPTWNQTMIDSVGWREAWLINAGVMWVVLPPLVWLIVRNRPADLGQEPYGAEPVVAGDTRPRHEWGFDVRQASRTFAFWALLFAGAVPALVLTGLSLNQTGILTDRGLDATLAATMFGVGAAAALPTSLVAGWLCDRYPAHYVLVAGQAFMGIGMVVLLTIGSIEGAIIYSALRGMCEGCWTVSIDVVWPSWFGRRHLGRIRSLGFAVGVVGAALGPIPFGLAVDQLGSYDPAILGLLILPVAAIVATLLARRPNPPVPQPSMAT
ncbi:MAG TPA: MFS transporter [Thermomicrobiales bacterium]|jgi:MFS family permease|nr:MFS transporter [Thermomicrobiales bacterium]